MSRKNLEHISVQQVGKELSQTLKENAFKIVLKAAYYAQTKDKKHISQREIEQALEITEK